MITILEKHWHFGEHHWKFEEFAGALGHIRVLEATARISVRAPYAV